MKNSKRGTLARIAVAACALATIVGCATTQVVQPAQPPGDGKARVYFIREKYPPYVHEARLVINGTLAATVANNDFVVVNVPVGPASVDVKVTDGKPFSYDMPVNAAEDIYVVLTGSVRKTGQGIQYNKIVIDLQWSLAAYRIDRAEAESIVKGFGKHLP